MDIKVSASQIRQTIKRFAACLVAIAAIILLTTTTRAEAASDALEMTVYRDPACSCCGGWIDHLAAEGFQPSNVPTPDMDALKQQYGVPDELESCHTAVIDGYIIEGHVPADDIKRLLAEHPDVVGIAVPGMPTGTPGMESGDTRDSFTVFSFDEQGHTDVFNQYSF